MSRMLINSPFVNLPEKMFSPTQTGAATAGAQSDIAAASNPFMAIKSQRGRGTSPNLFAAMSGVGSGAAAHAAAPVQQQLSDRFANKDWSLSTGAANNNFTLSAMDSLLNNLFANQRVDQQRRGVGMDIAGVLGNLFS